MLHKIDSADIELVQTDDTLEICEKAADPSRMSLTALQAIGRDGGDKMLCCLRGGVCPGHLRGWR